MSWQPLSIKNITPISVKHFDLKPVPQNGDIVHCINTNRYSLITHCGCYETRHTAICPECITHTDNSETYFATWQITPEAIIRIRGMVITYTLKQDHLNRVIGWALSSDVEFNYYRIPQSVTISMYCTCVIPNLVKRFSGIARGGQHYMYCLNCKKEKL